MDFQNYLKENAQKIDKELKSSLSQFLKEVKKTNSKLLPFVQSFVNSCKGGKRIRGVLVKLGYTLTSSKINNGIIKIGVAYEILHSGLLIHDDIIDQSPLRRGQPSLYQSLGGGHLGISQAISLGDIGLYLPIKIITETPFPSELKLKALNYFSQILIDTGWGQVMDVAKNKDIEFVNLYKTAKYTIAGPLQMGAILAGADDKLVRNLGIFGENLGIAFQIQDDILDKDVKDTDKAKTKVLEYASKAKKMIADITTDTKLKKILEGMSQYLVERTK